MSNELVSIIVPVYNSQAYIKKCVRSICRQTYSNLEIILVDDGSKDNSVKIIKKFAQKDSRIKLVEKTNGGVSTARNTGISVSTGEYITFVDSDDWLPDTAVFDLVDSVEESGSDISLGNRFFVELKRTKPAKPIEHQVLSRNDFEQIIKHDDLLRSPCAKLYKSCIVKENSICFPEGIAYGEDSIFVWRYLNCTHKISVTPKYVYFYSHIIKTNASQKYYKDVNIWMYSLLQLFEELYDIGNSGKNKDNKVIIANLGVKLARSTCMYYSRTMKAKPEAEIIEQIEETIKLFKKYIAQSGFIGVENTSDGVFAKLMKQEKFAEIYQMLKNEANNNARSAFRDKCKDKILALKRIFVYWLQR